MRRCPTPCSLLPFAFVALAMAALAGCDKPVEGKNDVLTFRYDVDEQMFPAAFSTAIGKGLSIGVEVFGEAGESAPASVLDATSADPSVAEVVATVGNTITLEARGPGFVEIQVRTTLGDDAFDVTVVDIAKVDVQAPGVLVSDNPPSKGLVGGTARFFAYAKDASGKGLIGHGPLPITIAPNGAAMLEESDEVGTILVRFGLEGQLTITGQADEVLTVDVVKSDALTGLVLDGPNTVSTLTVGQQLVAKLRGLTADGSTVVGVAAVAAVTSTNPAVCTITPNPKLGEGVFTITGKAAGSCRVEATLGDLAARHDLTVNAP